jgi:LysR family hydrogen peroxide-inducible transcriptional activator
LAILQQVAETEYRIADLREGVRGRLRVGVIPTIMPYFVAPRIGAFLKQYPEVDLQFIEDTTSRLLEYLQSAEIDLAVSGLPVRNEDVICSELFREELYMVVPTGHRFARQPAVNLQDVKSERLLLLKEGHCLREDVLKACTRGKAELHSVFETNQMESIFQLVRSGFGVSLVPEMALSHATACALVCLKTNHQRRVGYLRARRHFVSRPMREFLSWLRAVDASESKRKGRNLG